MASPSEKQSCHASGVPKEMTYEELAKFVMPQKGQDDTYKILELISAELTRLKLPFWLDGGSLLGAVRDGGNICPFDYDADIGIHMEHLPLFVEKVQPVMKKAGYAAEFEGSMLKIVDFDHPFMRPCPGKADKIFYPTVDIFLWRVQGSFIELADEKQRGRWPGCYHRQRDFAPARQYAFGPLTLPGPAKPVPYLNRMYPGWRDECVVDCFGGVRFAVPICAERRKVTATAS